jgi:class 3 adenylate cyclase
MPKAQRGRILVVDDHRDIRELLCFQLEFDGHTAVGAENGCQALELMRTQPPDLLLLDIMMPAMNGYQVLEHLKGNPALQHIPVIVISAFDDLDSVVKCIKLGAEDYLFKPFNPVLLQARVDSCLEKKWLRDQDQAYLKRLEAEQQRSEQLLLNILPAPVADRLKASNGIIAESFAEATVLFADIIDFTRLSSLLSHSELVELLNEVFSVFDRLTEQYGLEKIKTIGDAYMVVGGLPTPREDHVEAIARMALDMLEAITHFSVQNGEQLQLRLGIHTGPVIAGIIGKKKFSYDLWGDTVNIASRMESHGLPGRIQVTQAVYECLRDQYHFEKRGPIDVKGKGELITYLLTGRQAPTNVELPEYSWLAETAAAP